MPVKVDKISVDFDPYSETVNVVTRKCYRSSQTKEIDCFKRLIFLIMIMLNTLLLVLNA